MAEDRRRDLRQVTCLPASVHHQGGQDLGDDETAMIADVSTTGARLLMRNPELRAGEVLELELQLDTEGKAREKAKASVMRVSALPDERVSVWTHEVAVAFASPIPLTEAERKDMQARMAALGIRR